MENDPYDVLFDEHGISKCSPLFGPIKSSRHDRSEKKRRINVGRLFEKKP